MQWDRDNLAVLAHVASVFEQLKIAHALGGSIASSIHGVPRFTRDANIRCDPFADRVAGD